MKPFLNLQLNKIHEALDKRYHLSDESKRFYNLVNFSQNSNEPFHRWSQYREGYSGLLVKELIKRSEISHNGIIFDPMCGSGTTLVSGRQKGHNVIGTDVNDFSVYLTKSKMKCYNLKSVLNADKLAFKILSLSLLNAKIKDPLIINEQYKKYYKNTHFKELLLIREIIENVKDSDTKRILFTAWLCILEPCSNRKRDGNGLATQETRIISVKKYYYDKVKEITGDILKSSFSKNTRGYAIRTSAVSCNVIIKEYIKQLNGRIEAVIFSPPYMNSFDYFESYKLENLLGGFVNQEEMKKRKQEAVRSFRTRIKSKIPIHSEYLKMVLKELDNGILKKEEKTNIIDARTRLMANVIPAYFQDMERVIKQIWEIIVRKGKCFIVVDQSAYAGVLIPTDQILANLAEKTGFYVDQIIRCRKATTSGQQLKMSPHLNGNLRESIIVLRK